MNGGFDDDLVHAWLLCLSDNAWCSLHYESPALQGIGRGEIHGGGYLRRKLNFSTPVAKTMWSVDPVRFIGLNANRITHFGIWNHKDAGKIRAWGPLPDGGKLVAQGRGLVMAEGSIALSVD